MSAQKKKPQQNPTKAWVYVLKVPSLCFSWSLWERGSCCGWLWGGAPAARDGSPLSTCLDGCLEGKGICTWVSQAKKDTHSPLLPTVVGSQHWCIELLYFVLSIPFLLKQDIVPWGAGLGRTKMCHVLGSKRVCFMPVKPPSHLQVVEQLISWSGHWWPEFWW